MITGQFIYLSPLCYAAEAHLLCVRALTAEAAVANGITKRERQAINSESLPGIIEQTVSGPALKATRARARTFKAVPLTSAMIIVPTRLPSAYQSACPPACMVPRRPRRQHANVK